MKQVTKKEMEFLKTIACSHFGDGERLLDYITEDDYDMKVVRGLIPSLVNKGIITYHDYENETPYAVINPDYHDIESDMLTNLETIPYVKVDLSGNSDLDKYVLFKGKVTNKKDVIKCIKLLKGGYYLEPKTEQSLFDYIEKEIK